MMTEFDDAHDDDENPEDSAPGWDAIDAALDGLYQGEEPLHWGTVLPYNLGGEDPLYGVSVYHSTQQQPHLHYVTYGFSELFEKEDDEAPQVSGFGFELTFRLAADPDAEPPVWVVNFLQNVARYVFESGQALGPGHTLPLNSPICLEAETQIRSVTFMEDPELGTIATPHGSVQFLQVVGLTDDELEATQSWNARRFSELLQSSNPLLVIDLERNSQMEDSAFATLVKQFTIAEGASASIMCSDEFRLLQDPVTKRTTLVLGAIVAPALGKRLLGRIPYGREFRLVGEQGELCFIPGESFQVTIHEQRTDFVLTPAQAQLIAEKLNSKAGSIELTDPPHLTLKIERTEIKDNDGNITDILG